MVKFILGMMLGTTIGIFLAAMCAAAKNADEESEKMMTVINKETERKCRDCKFHKIIPGQYPKHFCAAATKDEDWREKCPLKGEGDEQV